jgi:peptide/nickel transport system substrate-binding protein
VAADIRNPVSAGFINASCDTAMFGWPCGRWSRCGPVRARPAAKLKGIAEAVQVRETQYPTRMWLGQWYGPVAVRKNVDD